MTSPVPVPPVRLPAPISAAEAMHPLAVEERLRHMGTQEVLRHVEAMLAAPPGVMSPESVVEVCAFTLGVVDSFVRDALRPHVEAALARTEVREALRPSLSAWVAALLEAEGVCLIRPSVWLFDLFQACGGRVEPEAWVRLFRRFPNFIEDRGITRLAHRPDIPIEAFLPILHRLWTQSAASPYPLLHFLTHGPRVLEFMRHPSVRAFLLRRMCGRQGSLTENSASIGASAFNTLWAATMVPTEWGAFLTHLSPAPLEGPHTSVRVMNTLRWFVDAMPPAVQVACPAHHPVLQAVAAMCHHLPADPTPNDVIWHDALLRNLRTIETVIGQRIPVAPDAPAPAPEVPRAPRAPRARR